ncbi:MAG: hypothetical protein HC880_04270 [Bacteroidia bacterium]|nr:hypothetical protein [Bacteroidia bacterium]
MTNLGMMLSVIVFGTLGEQIKRRIIHRFFRRRLFNRRNRRLVRLWRKYGLVGIAFLTPPFLTPPVGILVATSFGENLRRIFLFMMISSLLWSVVAIVGIYFLGNWIESRF